MRDELRSSNLQKWGLILVSITACTIAATLSAVLLDRHITAIQTEARTVNCMQHSDLQDLRTAHKLERRHSPICDD